MLRAHLCIPPTAHPHPTLHPNTPTLHATAPGYTLTIKKNVSLCACTFACRVTAAAATVVCSTGVGITQYHSRTEKDATDMRSYCLYVYDDTKHQWLKR